LKIRNKGNRKTNFIFWNLFFKKRKNGKRKFENKGNRKTNFIFWNFKDKQMEK